jgi:Domain of unknown function (DUF4399)
MNSVRNVMLLVALVLLPIEALFPHPARGQDVTPSSTTRCGPAGSDVRARSAGEPAHAPKNAYLYIVWPKDGATIVGGFWAVFGLRNMGVTHAGNNFGRSGHHHLLIDVDPKLDPNVPIPQDKQHIHYGGGQTEGFVQLPPGKHTLQLMLGDANHFPFVVGDSADPSLESLLVSKKITVTVKEPAKRSNEVVKQGMSRSNSGLAPMITNGAQPGDVIEGSRNVERGGERGE